MSTCNDPRCPLNRQGVPHEDHDSIENKPVQNPCNDPRCAMNRMGMKHEVHDGEKISNEKLGEEKTSKQTFNDEFRGSATDTLHELGKQIHGTNTNRLSRERILEERRKRERESIEQEAQEEVKRRENLKKQENISAKSKIFSRANSSLPSINQILHSSDPYETFNISQESTCNDIKSKYKELSKNYNASRGSVNRTLEEQEKITKTQSKINIAYDVLRKKHCG